MYGESVSSKTNISGSKSTVWLHEESDSGIPHLHAIVSRVDGRGNINNDNAIHLRAQRAAERIARQRGWTTALHIHGTNIPKVSDDCMDALRELAEWSWEGYTEKLAAKGYSMYLRKDSKDGIRGYILWERKYEVQGFGTRQGVQPDRIPYHADMGDAASPKDGTGKSEPETTCCKETRTVSLQ